MEKHGVCPSADHHHTPLATAYSPNAPLAHLERWAHGRPKCSKMQTFAKKFEKVSNMNPKTADNKRQGGFLCVR